LQDLELARSWEREREKAWEQEREEREREREREREWEREARDNLKRQVTEKAHAWEIEKREREAVTDQLRRESERERERELEREGEREEERARERERQRERERDRQLRHRMLKVSAKRHCVIACASLCVRAFLAWKMAVTRRKARARERLQSIATSQREESLVSEHQKVLFGVFASAARVCCLIRRRCGGKVLGCWCIAAWQRLQRQQVWPSN
jgi:hypothetical protein